MVTGVAIGSRVEALLSDHTYWSRGIGDMGRAPKNLTGTELRYFPVVHDHTNDDLCHLQLSCSRCDNPYFGSSYVSWPNFMPCREPEPLIFQAMQDTVRNQRVIERGISGIACSRC